MKFAILTSNNDLSYDLSRSLEQSGHTATLVPTDINIGTGYFRVVNHNDSDQLKSSGSSEYDLIIIDSDTPSIKATLSNYDAQNFEATLETLTANDFLAAMRKGGMETPVLAISYDETLRQRAVYAGADEALDTSLGVATITRMAIGIALAENYDVDVQEPEPPQDFPLE